MLAGYRYDVLKWQIAFVFLKPLFRLFARFEVEGAEKVADVKKPAIVIANHVSLLDPFALGVAIYLANFSLVPARFMTKVEYSKFPLGFVLRQFGAFFVDTKAPLKATKNALKILRKEEVLAIFPEGTRSEDGKIHQFKPGLVFLAEKSKAPIVPAYISGTFKAGRGFWNLIKKIFLFLIFQYKIKVIFGEPFTIDTAKDLEDRIRTLGGE